MGSAVDRFNTCSDEELMHVLRPCCGSERWLAAVVAARPYATADDLISAADAAFDALSDDDWRQAFTTSVNVNPAIHDDGTRSAAHVALSLYQERFGYPFVIGTDHLGGEELLMRVRIRLGLEPAAQMRASRAEQSRLTRVRLLALIERSG